MKKNKYVNVYTAKDYFNLPRSQRTKWGFWYLLPRGLQHISGKNIIDEWDRFYKELAKEFPIQYWLRDTYDRKYRYLFGNFGIITSLKYNIKCLFKPYHSKLRAAIPRKWQDLDAIITNVVFAALVSFVEDEDGLDGLRMMREAKQIDQSNKEYFEKQYGGYQNFLSWAESKFDDYCLLEEAYIWIKEERPKAQKEIEEEFDVAKFSELDNALLENDDKHLMNIVKLRGLLWT